MSTNSTTKARVHGWFSRKQEQNYFHFRGLHFIQITAGSSNTGARGCELWTSTSRPIGLSDDRPVFVSRDDITVLHADDRVLIAEFTTSVVTVLIWSPMLHTRLLNMQKRGGSNFPSLLVVLFSMVPRLLSWLMPMLSLL